MVISSVVTNVQKNLRERDEEHGSCLEDARTGVCASSSTSCLRFKPDARDVNLPDLDRANVTTLEDNNCSASDLPSGCSLLLWRHRQGR
jgi:hypothetical protein